MDVEATPLPAALRPLRPLSWVRGYSLAQLRRSTKSSRAAESTG